MAKKQQGLRRGDVAWMRVDPYTQEVSIRTPRRAPAPSTPEAPPEPMVQCPDCGASLRQKRLAKHQRESCPARPETGTRPCPSCSMPILTTQLATHQRTCTGRYPAVGAPPQRRAAPPQVASTGRQQTGVFEDGGNFTVVYQGEVITIVGSAKLGWELLREHKRMVDG